MADDKGKTDFGQQNPGQNSGQNEKPKEGGNYADQMWKKIEQKSDLREKREELKQEFPDRPKKRRRKRHRRRHGGEAAAPRTEQKFEHKPESKVEEIPPTAPVAQVAPINPFATGSTYDKYPEAQLPKSGFTVPSNPFLKSELPPTELPKETPIEPEVVEPELPKEQRPVQEPEPVPINPFERFADNKEEIREIPTSDVQEVYDTVGSEPGEPSVEIDSNPDVIDVEPVETEPAERENSEGDFKEDFWAILEQAGITKKRILIFGIVLVVIILGIIAFFSFGGGDSAGGSDDEEEVTETDEISPDSGYESDLVGIISAYIFGLEHAPKDFIPIVAEPVTGFANVSGMEAGFIFGKMGQSSQESFVSYIDLLRRMENLYNTDVYNLVNLAVDRRAALNVHLIEMDSAVSEGLAVYELLRQQLEVLDIEYEKVISQRDLYENAFFEDITALKGQDSYYKLGLFTEFSQTALKIKAEYNAKRTIRDMLINALNILRPRYKDISTNAEALIKGVKVFDLPDSDIDAIIPP